MKYLIHFAFAMILLFSCCRPIPSQSTRSKKAVTDSTPEEKERASIRKTNEAYRISDSIKECQVIQKTLKYAEMQKEESYTWGIMVDSFSVKLKYGHLFDNRQKHLLIFNKRDNNVYLNIYLSDNGNFKNVISITEWEMTYTNYRITDVNGDGMRDLVFRTYSSAGCCARDANQVHLYRPSGSFAKMVEFLNPTFYPKEKIVRGVDYGHPGEVPLYKLKWVGEKIDTVEFIYPADTLERHFYRVAKRGDEDIPSKRQVLDHVPNEYRKTAGYRWFTDH